MTSNLLLEIQGLRGIAILSVFLFHLWPGVFPNGYVGVDMFFVISGYLMAMIFSKHTSVTFHTIVDFYYKRAKRILPLYYLALPLIFIASYLFIGVAWLNTNNSFALYSLAIMKNMKTIWDGSNYFKAFQSNIHTKDIFLHLWSLAVEIQFYLIVPFIFLFLQILKKKELKIGFLLILCSITCGQYYYSNPIFSFNYCLSRLWQFGLGMIAYIAMDRRVVEKNNEPIVSTFCHFISPVLVFVAFISILLMVIPQEISDTVMRPLATLSCFCLLFVETHISKKILTHKFLTYFGDISYSMYLIHWPVILLFGQKYSAQFVIIVTLLLSVLSYTYYENWYRKLSQPRVFLLFAGLALLNVWVFLALLRCPVVKNVIDKYNYNQVPLNMREAFKENVEFSRNPALKPGGTWNLSSPAIHPSFTPVWGIWDYPKGIGKRKVAIFGNSYTVNQMDLIHEEFDRNYSEFKAVTGLALFGLYDHWTMNANIRDGRWEAAIGVIEEFKPDVLFLVSRFDEKLPRFLGNITENPYHQEFNKNIARLEKSCGKIFIHGPTPVVPMVHLNNFIDAIWEGSSLDKFYLDKKNVEDQMQNILPLLGAIQCSKCQVYDIRRQFLDGNRYLTYDSRTNLSFFDNDIHLTLAGLDRIRPMYADIISKL